MSIRHRLVPKLGKVRLGGTLKILLTGRLQQMFDVWAKDLRSRQLAKR